MTREEATADEDAVSYVTSDDANALDMAIKALEQEPCGKDINVSTTDAISREAVDTLVDELARAISDERCGIPRGRSTATIMQDILDLPPVNPQPKTGHWIDTNGGVECGKCGKWYPHAPIAKNEIKFCSECGAKMIEPQESEVQDADS